VTLGESGHLVCAECIIHQSREALPLGEEARETELIHGLEVLEAGISLPHAVGSEVGARQRALYLFAHAGERVE
jgi:hypothetical protein